MSVDPFVSALDDGRVSLSTFNGALSNYKVALTTVQGCSLHLLRLLFFQSICQCFQPLFPSFEGALSFATALSQSFYFNLSYEELFCFEAFFTGDFYTPRHLSLIAPSP